jgi:hypothetical protein
MREDCSLYLQSRVGILNQHLKVSLVPLASFRRWLERIRAAAELIETIGGRVAGAVRFTTGLHPNKGISVGAASLGAGTTAESGIDNVAPSAPFLAATRVAGAADINDCVARHASCLKLGAESLHIELLVLGLVVLAIRIVGKLARGHVPLVPASNVGGNTTNLRRTTSIKIDAGKLLSTGRQVVIPAQPATVTSIKVHDDIGEVECRNSIRNALAIASSGILAGLEVDVGHQVGQRVGLNEERKGLVGVCSDDLGNDFSACQHVAGRGSYERDRWKEEGIAPSMNSVL